MQNQEIIKAIDNLKGRRKYEEKKASKLGFSSLYDYFEDKVLKQKKAAEIQEREIKLLNKLTSNELSIGQSLKIKINEIPAQ